MGQQLSLCDICRSRQSDPLPKVIETRVHLGPKWMEFLDRYTLEDSSSDEEWSTPCSSYPAVHHSHTPGDRAVVVAAPPSPSHSWRQTDSRDGLMSQILTVCLRASLLVASYFSWLSFLLTPHC